MYVLRGMVGSSGRMGLRIELWSELDGLADRKETGFRG